MALLFFSIIGGGYIFLRSTTFFARPDLIVFTPEHGAMIGGGGEVKITGDTIPKTLITINGYETFSDETGSFEELIPFQKGFHVLDIRVKNRVGKETRVVKHIIVQ